jgi:hypothetical protein
LFIAAVGDARLPIQIRMTRNRSDRSQMNGALQLA